MPCDAKIFNETDIDLSALTDIANEFLPHAQSVMGFSEPVTVSLISDKENSLNPLGKTAYYDPGEMGISLFVDDRHPKDILRSLSHELVHHTQNCNGMFDDIGTMGANYAQEDDHLREMEREAYELGNMCFRDWEDEYKKKQQWQLNEGALEDLIKGLKTQRGQWKNPLKGFAQAAEPGAGLTDETFGLGRGQKEQPHFTEQDPGRHWDERPEVEEEYETAGRYAGKEEEEDTSRAARKSRGKDMSAWYNWIFMHEGKEDIKKAFYSAIYEDKLDPRIKMSLYKKYSERINKVGYGDPAQQELPFELPTSPTGRSDYAGSAAEAGQGDLFKGPAPIRGGEGPQQGPSQQLLFPGEPRPGEDPEDLGPGGAEETTSAPEESAGYPPYEWYDELIGSAEDAGQKEYWQEIYNAAMDVAEQAGEEVSWHHIDTVWRELGRPAVGERPPLPAEAFRSQAPEEVEGASTGSLRMNPELEADMAAADADVDEQPKEYETPEYAEGEFAQAQRKAQLAQRGQVGKQASQISNKMINSAARKALRSIGLPKNAINKGNLHKVVKSVTSRDANIDYMNFEKELLTSGAFKTVPEEQQRELAKAIANELQSIGGVNFQFYDTPEAQMAAESLTFDEELKIRASVHAALDLIQERVINQKRTEYEKNHVTAEEIGRFAKLAGISPGPTDAAVKAESIILEGRWVDWVLDKTGLDQAHKWGSAQWDEPNTGGVVGDVARATGLAKAGTVLGRGLGAEVLDDETVAGDPLEPGQESALETTMQRDYEDRANERAEMVELAMEQGYTSLAQSAQARPPESLTAMRPADISRLGIRLSELDDLSPDPEVDPDTPRSRQHINDAGQIRYNIRNSEIAEAAERRRGAAERIRMRRSGGDWVDADGVTQRGTGTMQPPGDYLYDELAEYEKAGYGTVAGGMWTMFKDVGLSVAAANPASWLARLALAQPVGEYGLDALEVLGKGLFYASMDNDEAEEHARKLRAEGQSAWSDQLFGLVPGNTVRVGNRFRDEDLAGIGVSRESAIYGQAGETGFEPGMAAGSAAEVYMGDDDPDFPGDRAQSIAHDLQVLQGKSPGSFDPETGEFVPGEVVEIDPARAVAWEAAEREYIGDDELLAAIARGENVPADQWPTELREKFDNGFCNQPGLRGVSASTTMAENRRAYSPGGGMTTMYEGYDIQSVQAVGDGEAVCGMREVAQLHIRQIHELGYLQTSYTSETHQEIMGHRTRFLRKGLSQEDLDNMLQGIDKDNTTYADLLGHFEIDTITPDATAELFEALTLDVDNIDPNIYGGANPVGENERLKESLALLQRGDITFGQMSANQQAGLWALMNAAVDTPDGRIRVARMLPGISAEDALSKDRSGQYNVSANTLRGQLWTIVTMPYITQEQKHQGLKTYIINAVTRARMDPEASAIDEVIGRDVTIQDLEAMEAGDLFAMTELMDAIVEDPRRGAMFRTMLSSRVIAETTGSQALLSKHRGEMEEVEILIQANAMQNATSAEVRAQHQGMNNPDSPDTAHQACSIMAERTGGSYSSVGCVQTGIKSLGRGTVQEYYWAPMEEDHVLKGGLITAYEEGSFKARYLAYLTDEENPENFATMARFEALLHHSGGTNNDILMSASNQAREASRQKQLFQNLIGPENRSFWKPASGTFFSDAPGSAHHTELTPGYLDAAFNYAKLHQSDAMETESQAWVDALAASDNPRLRALFLEDSDNPAALPGPKSMFEIMSLLANPPVIMTEEDRKRIEEAGVHGGHMEKRIYLESQGNMRAAALDALLENGIISDQAWRAAQEEGFLKPYAIVQRWERTGRLPGNSEERRRADYAGRQTQSGMPLVQAAVITWFQTNMGAVPAPEHGPGATVGNNERPQAAAAYAQGFALIQRAGSIGDMSGFMRATDEGRRGPPRGAAFNRADISNSVFMSMWNENHGATQASREWIVRYAPDLLFKHLMAVDRRARLLPGGPTRTPAQEFLRQTQAVLRAKNPNGQPGGEQGDSSTVGPSPGSAGQEANILRSSPPQTQLNAHYRQAAEQINLAASNGWHVEPVKFRVATEDRTVDVGHYDPEQNIIRLWPESYLANRAGDLQSPEAQAALEAAVASLQTQLSLNDPPVIQNSSGVQIWPPREPVRENIKHSLSHLPNSKLIKEQITKAFINKDINISRKKLKEIVRQHILQELNNNA